ncbi:MAG: hypothetical protein GHCLOJNM_03418 [bacterium]|nr:hypothetical protein [bacterium]
MRNRCANSLVGLLALMGVIQWSSANSASNIIKVSSTGSGADGQSWESAFVTIADAIAAATSGDQIWVREGLYPETVRLVPEVSVYGGFSGTEMDHEFHRRDPDLRPSSIRASEGTLFALAYPNINLDEFTDILLYVQIPDDQNAVVGAQGAMIDGFIISGGVADSGGGVLIESCTMTIRNCLIEENVAFGYPGGGIHCWRSNVVIEDSQIVRNVALGGNPFNDSGYGGAISAISSEVRMNDCVIGDNTIKGYHYQYGAGVYVRGGSRLWMRNCSIVRSQDYALGTGNISYGGAIFLQESVVNLAETTIADNDARQSSAIDNWGGTFHATNCIFRNPAGELHAGEVSYSLVEGGYPGPGNIDADPMFVNPDVGDYRLLPNSPCIDSGTITSATTDLDGKPRPVDIVGVGTEGAGAFDMGAYEFQLEDFATRTPTGTPTITLTPTVTLTRTITRTKSFTRTPTMNETDFSPTPTLDETDFTATPTRTLEATLTPTPEGGQGRAEEVFHFQGLWHQAIGGKSKLKGDKEAIIDARDLLELIQRLANEKKRN